MFNKQNTNIMKKSLLIIIATFIVASLTTSCNTNYADKIIGKWEWVFDKALAIDPMGNVLGDYSKVADGALMIIEFRADGTFLDDGKPKGTWKMNGKNLTLNWSEETYEYKIVEASEEYILLHMQSPIGTPELDEEGWYIEYTISLHRL